METEKAEVGCDLAVKDDLEQQVAEFVADGRRAAGSDRIGDFIGLLDRIGCDGCEGLSQIPFASAVGVAQSCHHAKKAVDGTPNIGRRGSGSGHQDYPIIYIMLNK